MPARQNVHVVNSDRVQGEDSFVKVKRITVAEFDAHNRQMAAVQQAQKDGKAEEVAGAEKATREFYAGQLIAWNWVDDNGDPLPQPHNNPAVFETLTMDEIEFITQIIMLGGGEKKEPLPSTLKFSTSSLEKGSTLPPVRNDKFPGS